MGNSVYESIMTGLNEALADAQSEKPILKRHKVTVEPVKVFEADEIKKIRNSTGMSQKMFASYMGVSDKTVEAWEAGTNHPSGAASRLLSMIEKDKELIIKFPFVTNAMEKYSRTMKLHSFMSMTRKLASIILPSKRKNWTV